MTQPIQEPTTQRSIAQGKWGENQLFRRPGPRMGGLIGPWVWLHAGSTNIPDNTVIPVPFFDLQYDPALVTQGDIFDWTITDTGDPGVDRFQLQANTDGFYWFSLQTSWNQVTTNGTESFAYMQMRLRLRNTGDTITIYENMSSQDWMRDDVGGALPGEQSNNPYLNMQDIVYTGGATLWKPDAIQTTGVDRTLGGELGLFVMFLDVSDAGTWVTDSV